MQVVNRHDPHIGLCQHAACLIWHLSNRTACLSVDKKGNCETVSQLLAMEVNTVNARFPPNRKGCRIGDRE
jgi:hypothetical protein